MAYPNILGAIKRVFRGLRRSISIPILPIASIINVINVPYIVTYVIEQVVFLFLRMYIYIRRLLYILKLLVDELGFLLSTARYFVTYPFVQLLLKFGLSPNVVIGSGISTSYMKYLNIASTGIVVAITTIAVLIYFGLVSVGVEPLIAVAASLYVVFFIVLPTSIALVVNIPSIMYKNRGDVLESKFMILIIHLAIMLAGGMSIPEALKELITNHERELKHFMIELKLAYSKISVGTPIDKALEEVAAITPSQSLRELFNSLAAASRVGAPMVEVVNTVVKGYLERYMLKLEKETGSLGLMLEMYTIIAMVSPIIMGAMALLFALVGGLGMYLNIMLFISMGLLPLFSFGIMVLTDRIASRMRL